MKTKMIRLFTALTAILLVSMLISAVASAATPTTVDPTKLSEGTNKLLAWMSGIVVAAVPVAAVIGIGFHAVMQMIGDQEPQDIAHHKKRIRSIIKTAVIAQIPMTIIGAVLFFFV